MEPKARGTFPSSTFCGVEQGKKKKGAVLRGREKGKKKRKGLQNARKKSVAYCSSSSTADTKRRDRCHRKRDSALLSDSEKKKKPEPSFDCDGGKKRERAGKSESGKKRENIVPLFT